MSDENVQLDKVPDSVGTPESKRGPKPKVDQEDFEDFKKQVNYGFETILKKFDEFKPAVEAQAPAKVEAGPDEQTLVPPSWKQLVREILGEDFECELSLPESGGSIFRIIVPKEKSNASQQYWENFKRDIRSRELGNTGVKGVKEHCLLVRKNLSASGIKLPVYP